MYRSLGSCVTGSPCTMANGISTCSGAVTAASATAGSSGLLTTMRRSGFAAFLLMEPPSISPQMHGAAHVIERGARGIAGLLATFGDDVAHQLGVFLELLRTLADAADL